MNNFPKTIDKCNKIIEQSNKRIDWLLNEKYKENKKIELCQDKIEQLNKLCNIKKEHVKPKRKSLAHEYKSFDYIPNKYKIKMFDHIIAMNATVSEACDSVKCKLIDNLLNNVFHKKQKTIILYICILNGISKKDLLLRGDGFDNKIRKINYNFLINREIKEVRDIIGA